MERLFSIGEVAQLFGVSRRQIERFVSGGIISAVKVGRATRFFDSEVERVLGILKTKGRLS